MSLRKHQINIRVTNETRRVLRRLAKTRGISMTMVIDQLIRKEFQRLQTFNF